MERVFVKKCVRRGKGFDECAAMMFAIDCKDESRLDTEREQLEHLSG